MTRALLIAFTCAAALPGCIDFNGELASCEDAGRCADPSIQITVVDHYVTGTGVVDVPWAPSTLSTGTPVPTNVLQAFIGGNEVPVFWSSPGNFFIAADAGTAYLVGRVMPGGSSPVFFASTLGALDIGGYVLGRQNVTTATANTAFVVQANGMVAWDDAADLLELSCPNAGLGGSYLYIPNYGLQVMNPPVNGDTTLNMTVNWGLYNDAPLIDATQGDQTLIYQLATQTLPSGIVYSQIAAVLNQVPAQLTLIDDQSVTYSGGFSTVPSNVNVDLHYDLDGFNAVTPDILHQFPDSGVATGGEAIFVEAVFGGTSYGRYAIMPDVAIAFIDAGTGTVDEQLSFGDPFPSNWTLTTFSGQITVTPYLVTLPDGGIGEAEGEADIIVGSVFDGGPSTVTPSVGTVTNPLIDGQIADFATISNATATPIISWTPPAALNTPTYYTVVVSEIANDAPGIVPPDVVALITGDTQVQVPPGFLQAGHVYFVRFNAVYDPNSGFPSRPNVGGYPFGWAETLTWPFTP